MNRAAATKIPTTTMPIKMAMPALIRAEVLIPRIFSSVKTTAKKIFHAQEGTPGANWFACPAHQTVHISGLSM
jgi:spore maturation protein SpmA